MVKQEKIKVLHAFDYFLIGVCLLCVLALAGIDVARAQSSCMGTAEQCGFPQPVITQDPVLVLQRLNIHNRAYYAAELVQKNRWRSYGYDVGMAIYDSGRNLQLPATAAVRGEYDLELQRRSLCAGFAYDGAAGVYAGRALDCRRGVFD